ncbi:lamin tail domain-containing protein [Fibrobacter sp. UWB11]|uniref:lamin tail domain-containing protein n=1 Tax=Fibrobacter sp. UWB11 TaxID=1896202 RepID=UPI000929D2B0|nr:lamin tail domain-containing protein [Fibrobacter sp. UWB11]SIO27876.1 Lamin Tail Domain [Fibrobacter sp. UWB11]
MNTKKLLAVGTCVSVLGMFSACSDDASPVTPPESYTSSSSAVQPNSSGDVLTSSSDIVVSSSSANNPVPVLSSSSGEGVVDSSITNMGVSEIMYNAAGGSALEWIEVYIKKGPDITDMQLSNLRLDGAVSFNFPTGSLKAGEYVIVTNDVALFNQTYPSLPAGCKVYGPWDNDPKTGAVAKLVNEGDVVDVKLKGEGDVSAAFSNNPPWPSLANGNGRTLVYRGSGNEADPTSWGASVAVNGNPCVGNDQVLDASTVRLNEIKPYDINAAANKDGWVELYNSGAAPVDVAGWELVSKRKNDGKGKTWTIGGTNTVVPANGYLLLEATAAVFGEGLYLSDNGDEIYLYEVVGGARTGLESSLLLSAGKQSSGVVQVAGTVAQGAMATETPGAANSALKAGPIFISEIHYHEDENNPNDLEFLELVNKGTEAVTLVESVNNTPHGWKVEGVNLEFAATDVIPAGGKMVLFNDSLKGKDALLRARYTIPESVPICYYAGKLSNRGETVAVKKPYSFVENGGVKQWYYEISDATLYSDRWAGMTDTDGKGKSLNRKEFTTAGYGYTAWEAKAPTPGN